CSRQKVESCHLLFVLKSQCEQLTDVGFLPRLGCQFHWHNHQYRDFQDFLDRFSSSKRKKLKRERRRVAEAGVTHEWKLGTQIDDEEWVAIHRLYRSTFNHYGNYPALTLDFFKYLGEELGEQVVIIQALRDGKMVAASLCFKTSTHFYGRYWGAKEHIADLHFETCYYQGIEYCIQNNIKIFEPGAQGEHKVSRGFEPTITYSAHYLINPQFRLAIADFLKKEQQHVRMYQKRICATLPFKLASNH
ncbi:MAG TPA: GNAT family N-acetyltransferase, partial [Gammaproteobacteria bacterium]|nr:GNAT family N-acetyltransferase [Gammaproteobacteria bacterium]